MRHILDILKAIFFFRGSFFEDIYSSMIRNIDGSTGIYLRYKFYKRRMKFLGKNVIIDSHVHITSPEYISIDDDTHIDKYVILIASPPDIDLSKRILVKKELDTAGIISGEVKIGKDCHISQYVVIAGYGGVYIGDYCTLSIGSKIYSLTSLHHNPYNKAEVVSIQPYSGKSPTIIGPVVLENNVWAGINVLISPGIKIGKNSFIRSNSLVMKSFEQNSFIAGDPAIMIKKRYSKE